LEPLGFILGAAAFSIAVKFKKSLRQAAVIAASQALGIADKLKTTAYGIKEEVEDIVAEAQYDNLKRSMQTSGEMPENGNSENGNRENGNNENNNI